MPKQQGIQILTDSAPAVVMDTLAGLTALDVDTTHATGLLQSFLMKKVSARFHLRGRTADDEGLMVGLARGDATITEIKAALEDSQLERDNKSQAAKRDVLHETLRMLQPAGDTTEAWAELDVSLGGGSGIPFEDGDGWKVFVYNFGSGSLTTGSVLDFHATYWGIWL